ncbi:MAG: hypothetical protein JST00_20575 [Deltaproteobacteria bacterium]|nr:hypothetical protein [Deltaproteobacteria bacterium]
MRLRKTLIGLVFGLATLAGSAEPSHAGPLVDAPATLVNACKPTKEKPYPVVLVHGQAGDYNGMRGVSDRLIREGYCVYATNYGAVPGGANGQDHLWNSAAQIGGFIDFVMKTTGAPLVDVVGHSAGTGVLDNYVMKRGGASKVHAFVSFGGLHHPYAHLGIPRYADFDVYLPNLLAFGRRFIPGLTVKQVTGILVSTFGLDPALAATVRSPFVEDLFDASYWNDLHGGPSEPPDVLVRFFTNGRTLPTRDSVPGVCYTNIVGIGDFLVGGSTGWQDPTPSIDNYLLATAITANTHNDMLGSEDALAKMIDGLRRNCGNGFVAPKSLALAPSSNASTPDASRVQRQFEADFLEALRRDPSIAASAWAEGGARQDDDDGEGDGSGGGCAIASSRGSQEAPGVVLGLGLGLAAAIARRRRASRA